jgi:hypothetical protein
MSLTIEQSRDEIHTLFKTAWDAGVETTGKEITYWDAKKIVPVTNDDDSNPDTWARILIQHVLANQASLANRSGQRKYRRSGLVTVQVFTPLGTGLSIADKVYKIVIDAFEGQATPGNVWFRNVRLNEVGPSGSWFQANVIADFEYDEIK